jgi:hypothetical protein
LGRNVSLSDCKINHNLRIFFFVGTNRNVHKIGKRNLKIPESNLKFTKMNTRNIKIIMFVGSKVRRVRRVDNLTAICEPIV